jgi:hypothetical protein
VRPFHSIVSPLRPPIGWCFPRCSRRSVPRPLSYSIRSCPPVPRLASSLSPPFNSKQQQQWNIGIVVRPRCYYHWPPQERDPATRLRIPSSDCGYGLLLLQFQRSFADPTSRLDNARNVYHQRHNNNKYISGGVDSQSKRSLPSNFGCCCCCSVLWIGLVGLDDHHRTLCTYCTVCMQCTKVTAWSVQWVT